MAMNLLSTFLVVSGRIIVMKKLLIIFLFYCVPLEAKNFDFQKVYEVPEFLNSVTK